MGGSKEQPGKRPSKKPRLAQEKRQGSFVTSTHATQSARQGKGGGGELLMYLVVFGLVFVFFLNFLGIVEIPFLQFLRLGKGMAENGTEKREVNVPEEVREPLYQGPQLEGAQGEVMIAIEGGALGESQEPPKDQSAMNITPQEGEPVITIEPLPEGEVEPSEVEQPLPSPSPRGETAHTEGASGNLYRVAKIYAAMEPQEAVRILEQFSDEEVVSILASMKERQVAEILQAMPADRAASVAKKMMGR